MKWNTGRDAELGMQPLPFAPPTCQPQKMFFAQRPSGNAKYRVQATNGTSHSCLHTCPLPLQSTAPAWVAAADRPVDLHHGISCEREALHMSSNVSTPKWPVLDRVVAPACASLAVLQHCNHHPSSCLHAALPVRQARQPGHKQVLLDPRQLKATVVRP